MKVLVVGSGGREHALLWKAAQSPRVKRLYAAPGNAGMEALAELVPWNGDVEALADWALAEGIDLTLVGPEAPLVEGIADAFQARGLLLFGPTQKAAMIEGSKAFAKGLMERYGIPTARYRVFREPLEALAYLEEVGVPVVVKDSGLAAGKGVTVAFDLHQAKQAVANILNRAEGGGGRRGVPGGGGGHGPRPHRRRDDPPPPPFPGPQAPFGRGPGPHDGGDGGRGPLPHGRGHPEAGGGGDPRAPRPGPPGGGGGLPGGGLRRPHAHPGGPQGPGVQRPLRRPRGPGAPAPFGERPGGARPEGGRGEACGDEAFLEGGAAACVVLAAPGYPESPRKGIPLHVPEPPEGVLVFHAGTRREGGAW